VLYQYDVEASGTPVPTYTLAAGPVGMTINEGTGLISWTPSVSGTAVVTVTAVNSAGSNSQNFTINVSEPVAEAPLISSTPVTKTYVNSSYQYDVNASGSPVPTYTLTAEPAGMTIDEGTGLISWTPSATGTVVVTVTAINSAGSASQSFTLEICDALTCPAGMSSYWPLDETSGSVYNDLVGGQVGTCLSTACPTPVTGRVGGGQRFDGSTDGVNVPANASLNWSATDSFSLEVWMKGVSGQTCKSSSEVLLGRDDASTGLQWWLGCALNTGVARFQLRDGSGAGITLNGPTITDGSWHHLVAVRDGTAKVNRLYVDGTEVASTTYTYTVSFGSATAALNMGWFNHRSGPGFRFEGDMDEAAIYNRALSASEVIQHHISGLSGQSYCYAEPEAPAISSSAVTTGTAGVLYQYDVNASGTPVPTYTLAAGPAGMTINEGTGLISWTPSVSGTAVVTVTAVNRAGSNSQNFTIDVRDAVALPPLIRSTTQNKTYIYSS
jgi:hypothetical protein